MSNHVDKALFTKVRLLGIKFVPRRVMADIFCHKNAREIISKALLTEEGRIALSIAMVHPMRTSAMR